MEETKTASPPPVEGTGGKTDGAPAPGDPRIPPRPDPPRPLGDHLEELRGRLIRCLVVWGSATVLIASAFFFWDPILLLQVVVAPAARVLQEKGFPSRLVGNTWGGPFFSFLKIAGLGGLAIAIPHLLFEAWRFVSVGLYARERRLAGPLAFLSVALFVLGFAFSYFFLLPATLRFLLIFFRKDVIEAMPTLADTVSLLLKLSIAIGLTFEIPLIMAGLSFLGIAGPSFYKGRWREAIFGAFLLSALITPTGDPATLTLTALPLLALYLMGLWLVRLVARTG